MINFRPHHFLCALCFQGRGYSPVFIQNFQTILNQLQEHADLTITVTAKTDSICAPCPHNLGLSCQTEEKIQILDQAHANALAIKTGDQFTWQQAKQRIQEKISLSQFHEICHTCAWKEYGICEGVLKNFLQK